MSDFFQQQHTAERVANALSQLNGRTDALYRDNPEFRSGVRLLARVLPRFVDLMADDAERLEEQRGRMKAALEYGLPIHRTEAGWPRCSTCDGGGCPDCTDPA